MNEREFYRVIGEWQRRPFDWRAANCCHFAADVARCWGIDFAVPYTETPEQAAQWIREQGARSLYEFLRKRFGDMVAPLQAQRGWIAYCKGEGLSGAALGVIERKALFVGDRGLIHLPLGQVTGAFNPENWRG